MPASSTYLYTVLNSVSWSRSKVNVKHSSKWRWMSEVVKATFPSQVVSSLRGFCIYWHIRLLSFWATWMCSHTSCCCVKYFRYSPAIAEIVPTPRLQSFVIWAELKIIYWCLSCALKKRQIWLFVDYQNVAVLYVCKVSCRFLHIASCCLVSEVEFWKHLASTLNDSHGVFAVDSR